MIKKFANNWLYDKYKEAQKDACDKLKLTPSDCVIFGLANKGHFDEYHRGGEVNRLCFSRMWDNRLNAERD